uniref:Sushi domain-containing protein n=1 Tax=Malurus cyaneus samueli TaxID=2593467 RepID=A0A8C5TX36_9PASS
MHPMPGSESIPCQLHFKAKVVFLMATLLLAAGCGTPTSLLFAELSEEDKNQTEFPVGMTVNYTCRPGYVEQPQMSPTITCLENQTWSEAQEFCKCKFC